MLTPKLEIAQHYLTHLLREKLEASRSRIVVVSSGAVRGVKDPSRSTTNLPFHLKVAVAHQGI